MQLAVNRAKRTEQSGIMNTRMWQKQVLYTFKASHMVGLVYLIDSSVKQLYCALIIAFMALL